MPFITQTGNLKITEDVSRHGYKYDPETRKVQTYWIQKKFNKELILTNVGDLAFDEDHPSYQRYVFHGRVNREGMYFEETPWFRITTQDMDDENLWRFYERWRDDVMMTLAKRNKNHSQTVYYVPHVDDFQVVKHGAKKNFHFPIWFLDIIIGDGLIELYKNMSKPNQPGVRWITDEGVNELYDIYEARKLEEDSSSPVVKAIQDTYTSLKQKERTANAQQARSVNAAAKRAERDRLDAQAEAETKIAASKTGPDKSDDLEELAATFEKVGFSDGSLDEGTPELTTSGSTKGSSKKTK